MKTLVKKRPTCKIPRRRLARNSNLGDGEWKGRESLFRRPETGSLQLKWVNSLVRERNRFTTAFATSLRPPLSRSSRTPTSRSVVKLDRQFPRRRSPPAGVCAYDLGVKECMQDVIRFFIYLWRYVIYIAREERMRRSGTKLKSVTTLDLVSRFSETLVFSVCFAERSCVELFYCIFCFVFSFWWNCWCSLDGSTSGISQMREAWESQRKAYAAEFFEVDPCVVSFSLLILQFFVSIIVLFTESPKYIIKSKKHQYSEKIITELSFHETT